MRYAFNDTKNFPSRMTTQSKLNHIINPKTIKNNVHIALLFTIVLVLLMPQIVTCLQQASVSINISGTIGTNGDNLIFSSGFENSADGYGGENRLNLINTVTGKAASTYMHYGYSSGSPFWIEGKEQNHGITAHSGSYCLGLARQSTDRCEFQLRDWNWYSYDEWYFRMWIYFPSNWDVTSSSNGWEVLFAFGDSVYGQPQGYPYIDIALWAKGTPGSYSLVLEGRGFSNEGHTYSMKTNFALPRGQWSKWEIYLDRGDADASNAAAWVKVNNVQYLSASGFAFKDSANGDYNNGAGAQLEIYPQDLYTGSSSSETRYVDDLEIWNGLPT
jgi:hypothetical protein